MMNQTKLKILSVSQNYYIRGGSDRIFLMTNELLERQGHQVISFAAQHPMNQPTSWAKYYPIGADFEHPGPADLWQTHKLHPSTFESCRHSCGANPSRVQTDLPGVYVGVQR